LFDRRGGRDSYEGNEKRNGAHLGTIIETYNAVHREYKAKKQTVPGERDSRGW